MQNENSFRKNAFSAIAIMFCTLIARILGFLRIAVVGAFFGAGAYADVLNATFNIPNNLRKLLAEGAFSSAFIPIISEKVAQNKKKEAINVVRRIISFQLIFLIPFCILAMIFAEPLIKYVLVEFKSPELIDLSVVLFRYFINYLFFVCISSVLIAVLNSYGYFFIPALTPIMFSFAVIASIVFFTKQFGIFSMAVGVLSGGLFQIIFQTPKFLKLGFDFKLSFDFKNNDFKRILKRWAPVVSSAIVFTINQQIAMRFATGLEEGSSSALSYAVFFWQLPIGLFSASISTVLFPKMSRHSALNDEIGLKNSIEYGIKFLLLLLIPSSIILIFFPKAIIAVCMQRGAFNFQNTLMTAEMLKYYSFGLFCVGLYYLFEKYYYSTGKYKIPFLISLSICSTDTLLSLILKETPLRVMGLAISNSIAFFIGCIIYFILIKFSKKSLSSLVNTGIKIIISTIPAGLFLNIFSNRIDNIINSGSSLYGFLLVCLGLTAAVILTAIMFYILRIEIFLELIKRRHEK